MRLSWSSPWDHLSRTSSAKRFVARSPRLPTIVRKRPNFLASASVPFSTKSSNTASASSAAERRVRKAQISNLNSTSERARKSRSAKFAALPRPEFNFSAKVAWRGPPGLAYVQDDQNVICNYAIFLSPTIRLLKPFSGIPPALPVTTRLSGQDSKRCNDLLRNRSAGLRLCARQERCFLRSAAFSVSGRSTCPSH